MGRERTTGWLAIAAAMSTAAYTVWITQWTGGDVRWELLLLGLVPVTAIGVAGALVLRGGPAARGVAAFLAVSSLVEAAFLPSQVHFATSAPDLWHNWWSLGNTLAWLVLGVLALTMLRSTTPAPHDEPPVLLVRLVALVGGGLLAGSAAFAWMASAGAPQAGWSPILVEGQWLLDVANVLRLAAMLAAAIVMTVAGSGRVWFGSAVGLLLAQGIPAGVWLDTTWQDGANALAPGFWLALAGQLLMLVAVVVAVTGPAAGRPVGAPARSG